MLDVYTTDWAIKWLDREIKHPESTTQKMVDFLHDFRAAILAEAADRAMMWWYEGDKAMTEMNQINSLRAAIEGVQK